MRPHVGDVLVFKTLSLNEETWTPELSSYRTAEVRCGCSRSVLLLLLLWLLLHFTDCAFARLALTAVFCIVVPRLGCALCCGVQRLASVIS